MFVAGFSLTTRQDHRFFVFLLAEASGESEPAKVQALAGETVVLPCQTSADDLPAIEWSKEGLAPKRIILAYRNGRDVHGEKNELFHYRTSLIMDKLKDGNISLRISDVQLSDAGKYTCKTIRNQVAKEVMVQLSVGTSSRIDIFALVVVLYFICNPKIFTFNSHEFKNINFYSMLKLKLAAGKEVSIPKMSNCPFTFPETCF